MQTTDVHNPWLSLQAFLLPHHVRWRRTRFAASCWELMASKNGLGSARCHMMPPLSTVKIGMWEVREHNVGKNNAINQTWLEMVSIRPAYKKWWWLGDGLWHCFARIIQTNTDIAEACAETYKATDIWLKNQQESGFRQQNSRFNSSNLEWWWYVVGRSTSSEHFRFTWPLRLTIRDVQPQGSEN